MALYHRIKRQILSHVRLVRVVILLLVVVGLGLVWWWVVRPLSRQTQNIISSYNTQLPTVGGRTNFLLLGMAGGKHDGSDLTDTIIFVSVDSSGVVTMLSIPRDIWVPSKRAKINTGFYYGEQMQPNGGGFILAKSMASEVIDQPIQFAAVINFANFEKVIDAIGGVDINVERTFDDYEFPIAGKENDTCNGDLEYKCRFEHLHFDAGMAHMNGALALKYVRSRHANDEEGTDFARSARQEKLLLALKDKLISGKILSKPKQIQALYASMSSAVATDISPNLYSAFVKLGLKSIKTNVIRSATLQIPDQLYNPPVSAKHDGQWVLLPKSDDWKIIFGFVADLLNK